MVSCWISYWNWIAIIWFISFLNVFFISRRWALGLTVLLGAADLWLVRTKFWRRLIAWTSRKWICKLVALLTDFILHFLRNSLLQNSQMTVSLGMHTIGKKELKTSNDAQVTRRVSRVIMHNDYNSKTKVNIASQSFYSII
jgi:hypothetical protein